MDEQQLMYEYRQSTIMMVNPPSFATWKTRRLQQSQETLNQLLTNDEKFAKLITSLQQKGTNAN